MSKYKEENPSRIAFEKHIRKDTGFSLARKQYPLTKWLDQPYQQKETSIMWKAWQASRKDVVVELVGVTGEDEEAFGSGFNAGTNCAVGQIKCTLEDLGFTVNIRIEEDND